MTERLRGPSVLALVGRERTGPDLPSVLQDPLQCRAADSERSDDLIVGSSLADQGDSLPFSVGADSLMAPLGDHVIHVLAVTAQEEMAGSAAGRVVTPVADFHALGNRAVGEGVGDAVSMCPPLTVPYPAVPLAVASGALPRPATLGAAAVYACPEAGSEIGDRSLIATGARAEPLRGIDRLPGVGSAEEDGAAPFARQCDTLRGHQVSPSPGVTTRAAATAPGLCMVILP